MSPGFAVFLTSVLPHKSSVSARKIARRRPSISGKPLALLSFSEALPRRRRESFDFR